MCVLPISPHAQTRLSKLWRKRKKSKRRRRLARLYRKLKAIQKAYFLYIFYIKSKCGRDITPYDCVFFFKQFKIFKTKTKVEKTREKREKVLKKIQIKKPTKVTIKMTKNNTFFSYTLYKGCTFHYLITKSRLLKATNLGKGKRALFNTKRALGLFIRHFKMYCKKIQNHRVIIELVKVAPRKSLIKHIGKAFRKYRLAIVMLMDKTPMIHNGCRAKKLPRK